jgi:hypothetical protein
MLCGTGSPTRSHTTIHTAGNHAVNAFRHVSFDSLSQ